MKKIVALLLVALIVLTGCTPKPAGDQGADAGTDTPTTATGSVVVNLGAEPPKLNPILTTDSTSGNVIRHTAEGLVRLDQKDLAIPGVAESWEVSEDGLTYTFKLRPDAKWSDGVAVTANDFAFAWKTVLTPETAAEYNYFLFPIVGAEDFNTGKGTWEDVAIKVIDDTTLEVTLIAPTPYFLSQLAFPTFMPVREDVYTGDDYATEADKAVYNGPYLISEWVHDDHITLTLNPEYAGEATPTINEIKMMMILDSNTAFNSFQSGELDLIGLTGPQVIQLNGTDTNIQQYSDGSSWVVAFNHKNEQLQNENLRKALTLALDRQSFITNILQNNSVAALSWTTPDISVNGETLVSQIKSDITDNDIEGAKAALELAKKELGVNEFKFGIVTDDTDQARNNAVFLQSCWANIGVTVDIIQVPFKERLARQTAYDYDISLYGWGPDYNDPLTFLDLWTTTSGNNIIAFSDAKYDENIKNAMIEPDTAKRAEMLIECEEILVNGYHMAPIYFRMRDYALSPKLEGVYRSPFQDLSFMWATIK